MLSTKYLPLMTDLNKAGSSGEIRSTDIAEITEIADPALFCYSYQCTAHVLPKLKSSEISFTAVTAIWAPSCFVYPHTRITSDTSIPNNMITVTTKDELNVDTCYIPI